MRGIAPGVFAIQRGKEFSDLLNIYRLQGPKYVVEVGSYKGGTLYYWLQHAQPGAHIISVDCGPECWGPEDQGFDKGIWRTWVPPGIHLHEITGDSHAVSTVSQVKALCPMIDFLFIDGDHSYEGVKADYETYGSLVGQGGVIAFHDVCYDERTGVWKLFAEIQSQGLRTTTFTSKPDQTKMGIGVLFK